MSLPREALATMAAQAFMKGELGNAPIPHKGTQKPLVIDGRWGGFTQKAYTMVSPETKAKIDTFLQTTYRLSADGLYNRDRAVKASELSQTIEGEAVSEGQVVAAIRREAARRNLPGDWTAVISDPRILKLEAAADKGQAGHYKVFSLNPNTKAAGIFQFMPATWNAVAGAVGNRSLTKAEVVGLAASKLALPGSPFDVDAHIRAYVELAVRNIKQLRANKPPAPITVETVYAAHQQGAGGFLRKWRRRQWTRPDLQSPTSLAVLETAAKQMEAVA